VNVPNKNAFRAALSFIFVVVVCAASLFAASAHGEPSLEFRSTREGALFQSATESFAGESSREAESHYKRGNFAPECCLSVVDSGDMFKIAKPRVSETDSKMAKDATNAFFTVLREFLKSYETNYLISITSGGKNAISAPANIREWRLAVSFQAHPS
jgi:hypothetical protein